MARICVQFRASFVKVVRKLEFVRITVRSRKIEAVIPVIGQRSSVSVIDVPVELDQILLVFVWQGRYRITGIVVPTVYCVARDGRDSVELGL